MARRSTVSDSWGTPINPGPPANTEARDGCPYISADGLTYYFASDRDGGQGAYDLWQASIDPVVDLDGDGLVDRSDIDVMLDNWGTDDSLCDIGPTPFGDGVVDVQDLIVLVECMIADVAEEERSRCTVATSCGNSTLTAWLTLCGGVPGWDCCGTGRDFAKYQNRYTPQLTLCHRRRPRR